MYTLDTNAIIYYLKDDPQAVAIMKGIFEQDVSIYLSSISEIELFGFPDLTVQEELHIEELLNTLSIIPIDSRVARIAGYVRRMYNLKTADSVIAATALFTRSKLITRNVKHFKRVVQVEIVQV